MADAQISRVPPDPADAVRELLATAHGRNAVAPLDLPTDGGVFPAAVFIQPSPVVADTRCLGADIGYACRNDRRTTVVTAAKQQAIRVFCSQHVVNEVIRRRSIWSTEAKQPVADEDFVRRLLGEYAPVLRVVPDDAIPSEWLSPEEHRRLKVLAAKQENDIPSVKLALVTRGLYWSKDKPALRAAYGEDSELVEHGEWLARLQAGSDAAELMRMLHGANALTYASGYGIVSGARRVYGVLGPASVLIAIAASYGARQWLRQPSRQKLRSGIWRGIEICLEVEAEQRARQQDFDAALPPVPSDGLASPDAVLGRTCIYHLAREPNGNLSAQELAAKVRRELPCGDARVRAILRSTACFSEAYNGRWQVGTDHLRIRLHIAEEA